MAAFKFPKVQRGSMPDVERQRLSAAALAFQESEGG
jgi:hypothetical protein